MMFATALLRLCLYCVLLSNVLANTDTGHTTGVAPKNDSAPVAGQTPSSGGFDPNAGSGASAGNTQLAGTYSLLYSFPGKGSDPRCGTPISFSGPDLTFPTGSIKIDGTTCGGSKLVFKDGKKAGFDTDASHSMIDKGTDNGLGPNPGGRAVFLELQRRGAPFAYAYTEVQGKGGPGLECGKYKYGPGTAYLIFNLKNFLQVPFGNFSPGERYLYVTAIGFTCIYKLGGLQPVSTPAPGTAPPTEPGTEPVVPSAPTTPTPSPSNTTTTVPNETSISGPVVLGNITGVNTTAAMCFPGYATVEAIRKNGFMFETVRMDELRVGDIVRDTQGRKSAVYGFSHRSRKARSEFAQITLAGGKSIAASAGHFLLRPNGRAVAAGVVRVGSFLSDRRGIPLQVRSVTSQCALGLYAPLTMSGTLVVDGVSATVYTTAFWPTGARAVLLPLRAQFAIRRVMFRIMEFVQGRRGFTKKGMLNMRMLLKAASIRAVC